jgi:hypothetical protein
MSVAVGADRVRSAYCAMGTAAAAFPAARAQPGPLPPRRGSAGTETGEVLTRCERTSLRDGHRSRPFDGQPGLSAAPVSVPGAPSIVMVITHASLTTLSTALPAIGARHE